MKARRITTIVNVIKFTGDNMMQIENLVNNIGTIEWIKPFRTYENLKGVFKRKDSSINFEVGDYFIIGQRGELHICRKEEFEDNYKLLDHKDMLLPGDKVIIKGCLEETSQKGNVFEVLSKPYNMGTNELVKIECKETGKYYGGGFSTEYLVKVEK